MYDLHYASKKGEAQYDVATSGVAVTDPSGFWPMLPSPDPAWPPTRNVVPSLTPQYQLCVAMTLHMVHGTHPVTPFYQQMGGICSASSYPGF